MIEEERQQRILERLEKEGFVSVRELMSSLDASRSTIMRDLIELEEEGRLVRAHGGASLVKNHAVDAVTEPATAAKAMINAEKKRVIAEKAAVGLQDHECVYIDSGTTSAYMIPYLADKDLLLVTSSIYLIRRLPDNFRGSIVLLGGNYDRKYDMSSGALTMEMIGKFNFNHAFFTANGFSIQQNEAYVSSIELGAVKKAVLERCGKADLLVDSTKCEVTAVCTYCHLDEMNHVYVDDEIKAKKLPKNFIVCNGGENESNR